MPKPLIQSMPPDLDLPAGYTVRFAAIDALTGATVAGVVADDVTILDGSGAAIDTGGGGFQLVPGPTG